MAAVSTYCKCGCGERIAAMPWHADAQYKNLVIEFKPYHKKNYVKQQWILANTNIHKCNCGCGSTLTVNWRHKRTGLPKFIAGHQTKMQEDPSKSKEGRKNQNSKEFKFTFWQRIELLRLADFKCEKCGYAKYDKLQFDHIKPLCVGGGSDIDNGQVLCKPCHVEKTKQETVEFGYNTWRYKEGKPFVSIPSVNINESKDN